jgi:branched-chain amino acid transport system ATP-binding protein/branched-chain amino acid transport system permease protein
LEAYLLYTTTVAITVALLAQATDLKAGHAGAEGVTAVISAGVAAYVYGGLGRYGRPWMAIGLALSITMLVMLAIDFLLARLNREDHFLGTLGLQLGFVELMSNARITGGALGMRDIPVPTLPYVGVDRPSAGLLLSIAVFMLAQPVLWVLTSDRCYGGLWNHWLRDDESDAVGYGAPRRALLAIRALVHAMIGGGAGIGLAVVSGYIAPATFGLTMSLTVLTVVYVSGSGAAPIAMVIGAVLVTMVDEVVALSPVAPGLVGPAQQLVVNVTLVLVLAFARRGFFGPVLESGPSARMVP